MTDDRTDDPAVVAWVEAQPRHLTYSELAAACLQVFGPARAWNAERLRRYWQQHHPTLTQSLIDRDPEIVSFLRERVGRISVDQMLEQCRAFYSRDRVPSRSAVYRWVQREREREAASAAR